MYTKMQCECLRELLNLYLNFQLAACNCSNWGSNKADSSLVASLAI